MNHRCDFVARSLACAVGAAATLCLAAGCSWFHHGDDDADRTKPLVAQPPSGGDGSDAITAPPGGAEYRRDGLLGMSAEQRDRQRDAIVSGQPTGRPITPALPAATQAVTVPEYLVLGSVVANFAQMPSHDLPAAESLPLYLSLFEKLGWLAAIGMLLALLLLPMMNRLSRQHQRCAEARREEETLQAQAMVSAQ